MRSRSSSFGRNLNAAAATASTSSARAVSIESVAVIPGKSFWPGFSASTITGNVTTLFVVVDAFLICFTLPLKRVRYASTVNVTSCPT